MYDARPLEIAIILLAHDIAGFTVSVAAGHGSAIFLAHTGSARTLIHSFVPFSRCYFSLGSSLAPLFLLFASFVTSLDRLLSAPVVPFFPFFQ